MHPSWKEQIGGEVQKPYFLQLAEFLKKERETQTVFPPKDQVFTAFKVTPFDAVKILILGQDPYHNAGQAHGMSASNGFFGSKPFSRANAALESWGETPIDWQLPV